MGSLDFLKKKCFSERNIFYFHSFFIALLYQLLLTNCHLLIFPKETPPSSMKFPPWFPLVFWNELEACTLTEELTSWSHINVFLPGVKHLFSYIFETCVACLSQALQFSSHESKIFSIGIILKRFTFLLPLPEKPFQSTL